MKYVLLGTLSAEWASRQAERLDAGKAKLSELGIDLVSANYTQGEYDFVDVIEAPDPEAMLTFSVWYCGHGYGRIRAMPAFDEAAMENAVARA